MDLSIYLSIYNLATHSTTPTNSTSGLFNVTVSHTEIKYRMICCHIIHPCRTEVNVWLRVSNLWEETRQQGAVKADQCTTQSAERRKPLHIEIKSLASM